AHSTFDPAPRSGRRMMSTSASSQMMTNGMAISVGRSMESLRRCAERTSARLARASSERGDASSVTGCDVVPVAEVRVVNDTRERALSLTRVPVRLADLALAFDESRAATAEVLVAGRGFFPPMLADIAAAASSVHINQFGFRPGTIGDAFATALIAKAAEGVHIRVVVDGQG